MEKEFYIKQMMSSDELCYAHALTLDEDFSSSMSNEDRTVLDNAIEHWELNESFDDNPELKDAVIELFEKYYKSTIEE